MKKKIIISFSVLILLLFLVGCEQQAIKETKKEPITLSAKDLVAGVEDGLPTAFKIGDVKSTKRDKIKTKAGYIESAMRQSIKNEGFATISTAKIFISKFDTNSNAKIAFDEFVRETKAEGGYEEFNTRAIKADCFGSTKMMPMNDAALIICNKRNIIFETYSGTFIFESKDYAEEFAKKQSEKINRIV